MHLQPLTLSLLTLFFANTATVSACAKYADCKCHDSNTGLQNDDITEKACKKYNEDFGTGVTYSADPHHQVCSHQRFEDESVATATNIAIVLEEQRCGRRTDGQL